MKKLTEYKPLTLEQVEKIKAMIVYSPKMAKYSDIDNINLAAKQYNDTGWNVFLARHRYHNSDDLTKPLH